MVGGRWFRGQEGRWGIAQMGGGEAQTKEGGLQQLEKGAVTLSRTFQSAWEGLTLPSTQLLL